MEGLERDLATFAVQTPSIDDIPSQKEEVPLPYSSNSIKEMLLLAFADNFQRQFRQLYGDRKTLYLKPLNECGIEKFVCTTLRPTHLPFKELYEYDQCAEFIADYLMYKVLDVPNELPTNMVSSSLVLKEQRGNCFEYANLLASLLIGVGYDAYCVCGYASQDVTLLNQIRKTCPQLRSITRMDKLAKEKEKNRYLVRPPRDLSSQFEKRQVNKERLMVEEEVQQKRDEEAAKISKAEAPPPDLYHGLRFHCWVLVLSGKREVAQSFFIEPTTGEDHPLDWEQYLGIEALWNNKNYWVNMQDCSQGVQGLSYDLGNATLWEFFFPNVEKPLLIVPGEIPHFQDQEEEEIECVKVDFQLPPSWVVPIDISPKDLETRCPRGSKQVLYYRAKVEKFAEYLNQDGLVSRVTSYDDTARTRKSQVKSIFKHRIDALESRTENIKIGELRDCFAPGRPRALQEHIHYENNPLRAANRTMLFYSYARVDGLSKKELGVNEMTEYFKDRPDFLYYRCTMYAKLSKKSEIASIGGNSAANLRPILKIVERFYRNPDLSPNSDIAERVFLIQENRINVSYHLEKDRIIPSKREFVLPSLIGDQGYTLQFDPELTTGYQVDPYAAEPKNRDLFELLESLLQAQEESISTIRESEREAQAILNSRMQEELNTTLSISVYDVARNETARTHRRELESKLAEEERIRKEKEKDYLAPFAARIGDPAVFDKKQMEEVSKDCLRDLRSRLVDMANIIQSRFEEETEELLKKQSWFKSKQGSLTREEEKGYIDFCNDSMFRIHILEQRLNRHKMTAPIKYKDLEIRLRNDPRLIPV